MNIFKNSLKKSQKMKKNHSSFVQLPDFLFFDDSYDSLSNEAKLLFAFLLRRYRMSMKNYLENGSWCDEQGVFILFPRTEMTALLKCSENKVRRLLAELHGVDLIREKRQGINKPNLIYIIDPTSETAANPSTVSEPPILIDQEPSIQRGNKKNNTYKNNVNRSSTTETLKKQKKDIVNKNKEDDHSISPEPFVKNSNNSGNITPSYWKNKIQQLLDFIRETNQIKFRINGKICSIEQIRMQFKRVNQACIDYVTKCVSMVREPIRNPQAYLLSSLYNAPDTIDIYEEECKRIQLQNYNQKNTEAFFNTALHHQGEHPIQYGDLAYLMDTLD